MPTTSQANEHQFISLTNGSGIFITGRRREKFRNPSQCREKSEGQNQNDKTRGNGSTWDCSFPIAAPSRAICPGCVYHVCPTQGPRRCATARGKREREREGAGNRRAEREALRRATAVACTARVNRRRPRPGREGGRRRKVPNNQTCYCPPWASVRQIIPSMPEL